MNAQETQLGRFDPELFRSESLETWGACFQVCEGCSATLRCSFFLLVHLSILQEASLLADSNKVAGCIASRSYLRLCKSGRRDQRPCSSTPLRWDSERAPCQIPLLYVSPTRK